MRLPKLARRVKLVAEFETRETTEIEVAHVERDEQAGLADLGLRLAEAKRLTAAIQAEMVPTQVTIAGESRRTCVRRLLACPCQGVGEAKSLAAFDFEAATVAPELPV
jgi:hypothetical protein